VDRHEALRTTYGVDLLMTMRLKAQDKQKEALMLALAHTGEIVYGNEAAVAMFGPVEGRQAHHTFLDTLHAPFKLRLEDSQVGNQLPIPPGHELWAAVTDVENGYIHDRVEITDVNEAKIDVALTMQLREDTNGVPCFVQIELLDIGKLNKDHLTGLYKRDVAIRAMIREGEFRQRVFDRNPKQEQDPMSVIFIEGSTRAAP